MTEDWQPIETAPKDGTYVDIWAIPLLGDGSGFRVPECLHYVDEDGDGDYIVGALTKSPAFVGGHWFCQITHWRPMPAPPKGARALLARIEGESA
jgi:hypothetical protein